MGRFFVREGEISGAFLETKRGMSKFTNALRLICLLSTLLVCCSPLRVSLSVYNASARPVTVRIGDSSAQTVEPGQVLASLRPIKGEKVVVEAEKGSVRSWTVGDPGLPASTDSPPIMLVVGRESVLAAAILVPANPAAEGPERYEKLAIREVLDFSQAEELVPLPGRYLVVAPKATLPASFGGGEGILRLVQMGSAPKDAATLERVVREQVGAELTAKPEKAKK